MSERVNRSVAVVLPGLLLAMFLGAIDLTIMAPALPAVAQDLGGLDQIPVVVTGYLLAATAMMPIYGKLGDRFGRKPVMLASIGLFVAGAALCIFATSMTQLAAFRAVQGLGGGGLSIGAQAIIGEIISPRERGRYLGYIGAAYVVAAVGGPLLGGFLIDHVGWRGIFVIYLPLGIAAAVIMWFTLRLPRPSDRLPVDYFGALSLAATVVGIVLLGQTRNLIFAGLAVVGLLAWLVSARSAADPILPLRLFRDRKFAIPVSVSFLIGFALFGVITYLPTFLQVVSGLTADPRRPRAHRLDGWRPGWHSGLRTADHPQWSLQDLSPGGNRHRRYRAGPSRAAAQQRPAAGDRGHDDHRWAGHRTRHAGHGAGSPERGRVRRSGSRDVVGHISPADRCLPWRGDRGRGAPQRWRTGTCGGRANPGCSDATGHRFDGAAARTGLPAAACAAGDSPA